MTSETRTIDLVALATELEAAGWKRTGFNYFTLEDADTIHRRERRFIGVDAGCIDFGWESCDYRKGATWRTTSVPVNVLDPHWQNALGIIMRHIDGSRS